MLLSLVLMFPPAAFAQTRAQTSIITQLLAQSLLRCYDAPADRIGAEDEVILRVELNTTGDISNLPEILSPPTLSIGERALLRQATVAIIDCTPIVSGGGEKSIYGRFEIVVNLDGLSLANVEASVGRVNIVPTFDDLKVSIEDAVAPAEVVPAIIVATDTTPSPRAILADEKEIELSRTDRREIQRRLVLSGYDTRGVDGVFGDGSRAAIRRWQQDSSLPISGYLDLNQLAVLRAVSQDLYAEWDARPKRYYDKNGCLREPNGAIVQGRSFKCDLSAASQNLGITK